MADPWRLTARTAKAALDRGELTATELVESCLARITAEDGELRAFITLCGERALREARASDQQRASGAAPRPLEGLPFAVKDVTATAGVRTTYGSRVHIDHVPVADELCIARLRKAGAILVGKTNTPEFGFGPHSTNALCGPTLNPYDRWLSSGGSSGGSAVGSRPEWYLWPKERTSADQCELQQASAAPSVYVKRPVLFRLRISHWRGTRW